MADRHTLLVVEDNDDFYTAIESAFARRYDLLRAMSSTSATTLIKNHADRLDAIILDMWLPRSDGGTTERNLGLEVLLKVKGRTSHPGAAPEVQVVVVTGHQDLQNAIESQRLGSFRYIVKGTANSLKELQRDVEAACSETKGRRIHKAIMEGGRLDLLEVLPLRRALAKPAAAAAITDIAAAAELSRTDRAIQALLQIRQLADEALQALDAGAK